MLRNLGPMPWLAFPNWTLLDLNLYKQSSTRDGDSINTGSSNPALGHIT
jgi:hypothetical protein